MSDMVGYGRMGMDGAGGIWDDMGGFGGKPGDLQEVHDSFKGEHEEICKSTYVLRIIRWVEKHHTYIYIIFACVGAEYVIGRGGSEYVIACPMTTASQLPPPIRNVIGWGPRV